MNLRLTMKFLFLFGIVTGTHLYAMDVPRFQNLSARKTCATHPEPHIEEKRFYHPDNHEQDTCAKIGYCMGVGAVLVGIFSIEYMKNTFNV